MAWTKKRKEAHGKRMKQLWAEGRMTTSKGKGRIPKEPEWDPEDTIAIGSEEYLD